MAFHEDLRNHRLKKGLILEEISEDTKINVRILQALEQGDYHILPVPYVRLFMKAYATAIDYPVEDVLRGLENELTLTGDQSSSGNVPPDIAASIDMTGAAVSNAETLLQNDRSGQNSMTRLLGGIIILLIVIIFGKSLLRNDVPPGPDPSRQILPGINVNQTLDSLTIAPGTLETHGSKLTISAVGYLSVVRSSTKGSDTLLFAPGKSSELHLSDSLRLAIYPSDAALLSIQSDTLPGSPFSNAWILISADSLGGHIKTFPTL